MNLQLPIGASNKKKLTTQLFFIPEAYRIPKKSSSYIDKDIWYYLSQTTILIVFKLLHAMLVTTGRPI